MYANSFATKLSFVVTLVELGHLDRQMFAQVLHNVEQSTQKEEVASLNTPTELSFDHLKRSMQRRWGPEAQCFHDRIRRAYASGQLNLISLQWFLHAVKDAAMSAESNVA